MRHSKSEYGVSLGNKGIRTITEDRGPDEDEPQFPADCEVWWLSTYQHAQVNIDHVEVTKIIVSTFLALANEHWQDMVIWHELGHALFIALNNVAREK